MSTPEDAVGSIKLRFWLDGVSTRLNEFAERITERIMAAVHDRGPLDYVRRDERRALNSVLRDLLKEIRSRPPPSMNNGDSDGGSKRMLTWILTVTSLLAVGGVGGAIVMYGEIASLRATLNQWQISTDRRLDRLESRPP